MGVPHSGFLEGYWTVRQHSFLITFFGHTQVIRIHWARPEFIFNSWNISNIVSCEQYMVKYYRDSLKTLKNMAHLNSQDQQVIMFNFVSCIVTNWKLTGLLT